MDDGPAAGAGRIGLPQLVVHSKPLIGEAEARAVQERLDSGMVASGETAALLEVDLARTVGEAPEAALAVATGTHALYIALDLVGVRRGDRVVLPTYACRAVADAVVALGAEPIVVDVGSDYRLAPGAVRAAAADRPLAAVVAVHPFGLRVPLAPLAELGVPVVEDCAHAFPGERGAAATIFSFHATKLIAAGEGGAVIARTPAAAARLARWRTGRETDGRFVGRLLDPLSDLAAALARTQLERIPGFARRRRELFDRYSSALPRTVTVVPFAPDEVPFRLLVQTSLPVDEVIEGLAAHGVVARRPYHPLLHHELGLDPARYPVAEGRYASTFSLPLYPALTERELDAVIGAVVDVVS